MPDPSTQSPHHSLEAPQRAQRTRRALDALRVLLLVSAVIVIANQGGRLLTRAPRANWDLAGQSPASLDPRTRDYLSQLDTPLAITYFVSNPDSLPTEMRRAEDGVRALLGALEEAAPGTITTRVIDPTIGGAGAVQYAARQRASAFNVRRVIDDQENEQAVWSSIVIRVAGGRLPILIQGIRPRDVPLLEAEIVARLRAYAEPPTPTIAVARHPQFQRLPQLLREHGRIVEFDPERDPLPREADVLFWMEPAPTVDIAEDKLAELRRFVDSGRSVILAGSSYELGIQANDGALRFSTRAQPGWSRLIEELGLRSAEDLLLDASGGQLPVVWDAGDPTRAGERAAPQVSLVGSPLFLRCLPAFYDLRSFTGPARGGLSFIGATALEPLPDRLREVGMRAELVATTTAQAEALPLPAGLFGDSDLRGGFPVARQNLAILLQPEDRRRGQVLVLASSSLFRDGIIEQPNYAHRVFLATLARTFGDANHLIRARLEIAGPPELAPMRPAARFFWRIWVVALIPALLTWLVLRPARWAPALTRHETGERARDGADTPGRAGVLLRGSGMRAVATIAVLLVVGALLWTRHDAPAWDVTRDQLHTPSAVTRSLVDAHPQLDAQLIATPRGSMPGPLKSIEPTVRSLASAAGLGLERVPPAGLSATERTELASQGIAPFIAAVVCDDSLASGGVWSSMRLQNGGRTEVIPRIDERSLPRFEFMLAAAIERTAGARPPLIAVVSDVPRLTPAEAYEDFQRQGLIPPSGTDVYQRVRRLLEHHGFDVVHVDPRTPQVPDGVDLFLWLQPRRDSSATMVELAHHLAGGGRAIVALQHFNIQQRQYRGAGFKTVHWPQPQFMDLAPYLQLIGVELVREVLMDRTRSQLELETQVNRSAKREYDPQQVALPFLIRTVRASYAPGDPLVRNLGDLLFIWGNRFSLDGERLAQLGLDVDAPITTTAGAWSFDWSGGWLPRESLSPGEPLPEPGPLTIRLRGRFPDAALESGEQNRPVLRGRPGSSSDGELLLIGCSEMFKDAHLERPGFHHDQLLVNAVAQMTLRPEVAELTSKQSAPPGLRHMNAAARLGWRTLVIAGGPALLLLLGLAVRGRQHKPVVAP